MTTAEPPPLSPSPRPALSGIWLPLITPFRDGQLDEAALAILLRHYLKAPVDGFILAATTGEALTLSDEEIDRLVDTAADIVAGARPLYLGLSGSDTAELARRLARTRRWPVDGYLISCPYYTRPSQEGLFLHFTALSAHSDKPIALYNIPYRTGVNLDNDTLLRLTALQGIVGIKDCCAIPAQTEDLLRRRPAGFSVMTGEDAQFFAAIAQGADGGILASAHIEPERFAAAHQAVLAGDIARGRRIWGSLVDVVRLLFAEPSPAPIKHWLWRRGLLPSPEVRLPITKVSAALAARIDAAIEHRWAGASAVA